MVQRVRRIDQLSAARVAFIFTLIGAALYNLVAGWVGGIQLELE
jgi:hypothetical protein